MSKIEYKLEKIQSIKKTLWRIKTKYFDRVYFFSCFKIVDNKTNHVVENDIFHVDIYLINIKIFYDLNIVDCEIFVFEYKFYWL